MLAACNHPLSPFPDPSPLFPPSEPSTSLPSATAATDYFTRPLTALALLPPLPIPPSLAFPKPPHLLPPEALADLPRSHLIALVNALSRDCAVGESKARELQAVEEAAIEGGVGRGELERARVRARIAEPREGWRIDLISPEVVFPTMVEEVTPTREDGVDLDDLADAIAENAFAGPAEGREEQVLTEGLQVPLLPAPHTTRQRHASLSSRIFGSFVPTSIPPPLPSAPTLPTPSTSPSPRRHQRSDSIKSVSSLASASSTSASGYGEWLGWRNWRKEKEGESGVEGSVRSGLAESVVESEGEEEEEETRTFDAITPMATPSGSLFCRPATDPALDDLSSSAPSLASLSTDPSSPNSSQPSTTASRRKSSNAPPLPLLSPHLVLEPSLSTPIPTSTLSTPLLDRHPILPNALLDRHPILPNGNALPNGVADKIVQPSHFTAVVSAAAWWAGGKAERNVLVKPDGVSTRIRELVESLLGNVAEGASISTRDGDAVDTVKPRKLPLLAIPDATSSLSSSSSTTSSKRASKSYVSVAKGSITRALGLSAPRLDGSVRRTPSLSLPPNPTPNLTLFPKLSSLSRYSPFAQPALATPSTQVSLSTGSTPIVPHAPPPPPLSAPTTMELDTISGEAAPPTLALHNPSTGRAAGDKDEGPMVDRYGFVYDIRSGMKLLREARRRQERAGRGEGSEAGDAEAVGDAAGEEAGAVERGQAEEEAELEELRGALGLPKSTAGSPTVPRSPATRRTDLPSSTTLSPAPLRPPRLVRSTSDSPPVPSGQQSMKRLLGLLTEMHDTVEKTRQEGWDAFIRRRQVALTKGAGDAPMRRERSRASGGEAGEDAWSENLVGVAQMGTAGKVGKEDWAEFKQLVRRGIPIAYRPK